jgi:NADH:ubiquinone oxidoreductase subunit F (NADH-binding)/NADH:ubiquinone oxidoreductase subunit E
MAAMNETAGSDRPTAAPGGDRATRRVRLFAAKGRQPDARARAEVRAAIGPAPEGGHRRDRLIEHLHRIQDAHGALRESHLVALAAEMRLSMAEVVEVASFYHHFDLVADDAPVAALTLRVCDGLSCRLAGAQPLLAAAQAALGSASVRVVAAPCIGRCDQAPAALAGQRAVAHASVQALADAVTCPAPEAVPAPTGHARYRAEGGYALARAVARSERSADELIAALEHSGLRGLGGAGFPAGRKWRIVRAQPAPRELVVNIDEGEPGTFKDRWLLERDPHRMIEGALVAAAAVGIDRVWLYLRDEYHALRALLAAELAALRADPPYALPTIELRRGAGAYICGEESALLESIEGKRGEPRMRPPYIAERGLFGAPTLEHNAETLYWVREIVERGPDWFAGFGRHGRKGLRSFSVSGRVRDPGVKLAPAGITLRELVDEYCGGMADGHALYAYLPGGASGGILPAALADLPLDFDTLQPHGAFIGSAAIIVLGHHDRARDAALAMMGFFAAESCGQCTPCRVGTAKAAALMAQQRWDRALLEDLAQVMEDASICGLGQAAPNPLRCVLRYFPQELEAGAP